MNLKIKKREDWIDVLRGFTMLLVVYWHVSFFTFSFKEDDGSFLNSFFLSFRMPMFFFISGFIAYKNIDFWTWKNFRGQLFKKSKIQLIPTIVFFIVLTALLGNYYKWIFPGGYWFTLILFEIFLIYYIISLISKYSFRILRPILIIGVIIILFFINKVFKDNKELSLLLVDKLSVYFIYFAFGLFVRRYWDNIKILLTVKGPIFILFVFIILYNVIKISNPAISHLIVSGIIKKLYEASLILVIFNFFYHLKDYWANDFWICKTMRFVGRRTLDIYMLHYFFLFPKLSFISYLLKENSNMVLELLIIGAWTILVTSLSLLFSGIIRSSSLLGEYLFGVKNKSIKYN